MFEQAHQDAGNLLFSATEMIQEQEEIVRLTNE